MFHVYIISHKVIRNQLDKVHQILLSIRAYVHLNLKEPLSNINKTQCRYIKGKNGNILERTEGSSDKYTALQKLCLSTQVMLLNT